MSAVRSAMIRVLDRPGGRALLGSLATGFVRRATGRDVGVHYEDGFWVRHLGDGVSVYDTTEFDFHTEGLLDWEEHDEVVRDTWLFIYEPKPGDTIMEVGAGTGFDVAVFSRAVGQTGEVYAVEAHPRTFEMLERTCKASGFDNVTLIQRAIVDEAGTVQIEDHQHHTENRLLREGAASRGAWSSSQGSWDVPGNTLDEVAREYGIESLDYLKMNIEGAEALAIRSMSDILSRTKHVCIACHDFIGDELDDDWYRTKSTVKAFLESEGFEITTREDDARAPVRDQIWGVRK